MLKGIEFIRRNSSGFKTLPRSLLSLLRSTRNDNRVWDEVGRLLRCARNHDRQGDVGRSMIEMLGVLAIIAVLSVGGIAGYSKAMEKYKINKAVNNYSYFIQGLIENIDSIKKSAKGENYADVVVALNLVPPSWKRYGVSFIIDDLGNSINLFGYNQSFVFEIYLGHVNLGYKDNLQNVQLCRTLFTTVAKPLSSVVNHAYVWRSRGQQNSVYYGAGYCGDDLKCLSDITLAEINAQCQSCDEVNGNCSVLITF